MWKVLSKTRSASVETMPVLSEVGGLNHALLRTDCKTAVTLQFAGTLWEKDSLGSHTVNRVRNLELFNVIKKELYSTALVSFLVDYLLWSECHLEVRKHGALYAFVLKTKSSCFTNEMFLHE